MIAPHFLLFMIFFAVPVLWSIYLSLFDYNLFEKKFVLFSNFFKLLTEHPLFYKAMYNTVKYTLIFVPLWLIKALIIAGMIQGLGYRIQTFFKAVFYIPHVTSTVIIAMIWLWIYNPNYGILNYILSVFGMEKVLWLGNPEIALYSIIFMQLVVTGGSSIVLISAAISSIPKNIYEAARLDGASGIQIFFRITLPMLKPVILYHMIIGIIGGFQIFSNIYVMTKGGPQFSTLTVMYLIYETAFENYDFGMASAQSVILALIICFISILNFRFFNRENMKTYDI
jgi:multiple sugar transport system permease protein